MIGHNTNFLYKQGANLGPVGAGPLMLPFSQASASSPQIGRAHV